MFLPVHLTSCRKLWQKLSCRVYDHGISKESNCILWNVPNIGPSWVNVCDVTTVSWQIQLLLEKLEEGLAIFFVELLANVIEAVLYIFEKS